MITEIAIGRKLESNHLFHILLPLNDILPMLIKQFSDNAISRKNAGFLNQRNIASYFADEFACASAKITWY